MTTSTPFQTALSDAPKMYATAVSHLEHAERLLLDGNQAMADVIARGSGMANPPHQFAIAQVHIDMARAIYEIRG